MVSGSGDSVWRKIIEGGVQITTQQQEGVVVVEEGGGDGRVDGKDR